MGTYSHSVLDVATPTLTHLATQGVDLCSHVLRDISDGSRGAVGWDGRDTAGILLSTCQGLQTPCKYRIQW